MGNRLSKITTRTGDTGTTGLGDGSRIKKSDPRVQAMGDVDELNSFVGLLLTYDLPASIREILCDVQHGLFDIGGEIAIPGTVKLTSLYTDALERALEQLNADLPPLKEFILPGGNPAAAVCHVARAVCRRAERTLVTLASCDDVNSATLSYLNRLSDFLFVVARALARQEGSAEVYWDPTRLRIRGT